MRFDAHSKRVLTGVALLAFVALALYEGNVLRLILVLTATAFALYEFFGLTDQGRERWVKTGLGLLFGLGLVLASWNGRLELLMALMSAGVLVEALSFLPFRPAQTGPFRLGSLSFGLFYVAFALSWHVRISPLESAYLMVCVAASDVMAYYSGFHFGGPKIWPSLSPGKTWSGSIGGLAGTIVASTVFGRVAGHAPWYVYSLLGLAIGVVAPLGDFFESALKRLSGAKDSGAILPGHGGALDRIDALLAATLLYACLRLAFAPF